MASRGAFHCPSALYFPATDASLYCPSTVQGEFLPLEATEKSVKSLFVAVGICCNINLYNLFGLLKLSVFGL